MLVEKLHMDNLRSDLVPDTLDFLRKFLNLVLEFSDSLKVTLFVSSRLLVEQLVEFFLLLTSLGNCSVDQHLSFLEFVKF
jgi:hypothetical protein